MKYFKFELKKFILNKRNRYLLALISSLIVVYSIYTTISFSDIVGDNTTTLLQGVQTTEMSVQDNIKNTEDILKMTKVKAELVDLNDSLNYYLQEDVIYQKQIAVINANDIMDIIVYKKKLTNYSLNNMVTNHHLVKINS